MSTVNREYERGETKVQLGCGMNIFEGFINIDIINSALVADKVREIGGNFTSADLSEGIPLPDCCADYVFSEDFLEHYPPEKRVFLMSEIYRILKCGGVMEHYCPNAGSINDFASPSHLSHWNTRTFEYFEHGNRRFENDTRWNGFQGEGFEKIVFQEQNVQDGVAQTLHIAMRKVCLPENQ